MNSDGVKVLSDLKKIIHGDISAAKEIIADFDSLSAGFPDFGSKCDVAELSKQVQALLDPNTGYDLLMQRINANKND